MNLTRTAAAFALLSLPLAACAQTKVTSAPFGKLPDGSAVTAYTLTDAQLTVRIMTFGAHILSIDAPDKAGKKADLVLGYNDLAGYVADNKTYLGSVVGRYGNRIAKGTFQLDGKTVHVDTNERGNMLHGGKTGFDRKNWSGKEIPSGVELTLVSPDGDMGFPGTLTAHVRYTLSGDKLRVDYSATTDKTTVVNLTQHSYFNLAGNGSGTILNELIQIRASRYQPVDSQQIPTGELAPVAGTPFDLRKPTPIGAHIHDQNAQLAIGKGYDNDWIIDNPGSLAAPVAQVTDPASGRTLKVYTVEPGIQFYSGNFLDGTFHAPNGSKYDQYDGFCLETQHFPDSPNRPTYPSTTLKPGQTYKTTTIFEFGVAK
jgi:aldose 1-epimerase